MSMPWTIYGTDLVAPVPLWVSVSSPGAQDTGGCLASLGPPGLKGPNRTA